MATQDSRKKKSTQCIMTSFEDVLTHIEEWGFTQKVQLILLTLSEIGMAFQNMGMVFLAGTPAHHCLVDEKRLPSVVKSGKSVYSQCEVLTSVNDTRRQQCSETVGKWFYDRSVFEETIVSEWNLVCEDKWLQAFSKTMYFFGFFVGCLVLSDYSDRYGRRITYLVTSLIQVAFSVAASFSPNYTVFTSLRFVVGFATGGQRNSAYVLTHEWCTQRMRIPLQAIHFGIWAFGEVLFGAIAYYLRFWRSLALATSLPLIIFAMFYWIVYPSPRWLLTKGRQQEALEVLHGAAKQNGRPLPNDFDISKISMPKSMGQTSIADLLRTPNMRKTTLILWYTWFVCGFVCYGLAYNIGNMLGDIYINFIVLSAVLFLRVPLVLALQNVKRRPAIVCFSFLCGVMCLAVARLSNVPPVVSFIQACISNLCGGMVFGLAYVYSVEVYPTSIRTIGLGIGSMWARFGSMVAPFVVLLSDVMQMLPFIVFGVTALILTVLFLLVPETHNRPLPDSVEDAEEMNELSFRLL